MTDHVMKLRAKGDIILAFGEELAKLRNHPELAWQHVWHDADACIFNEHEIKEMRFQRARNQGDSFRHLQHCRRTAAQVDVAADGGEAP